ncbi:MAG TPA: arsenate reductase (glutaredoxin) [Acidimicrobiales bacterium]|jgi:arsenate reductase|nr:arsenate reductase (glutaredoxin) [Acidimicrobiales bacterium]
MTDACTVWFNPRCSKCRQTRDLLAERDAPAEYREYLADAPTRAELTTLMRQLGIDDPRAMMRTGEAVYAEQGLDAVSGSALLDAIVEHPILLERPIVVLGDRAVIARPPERVQELLG